MKKMMLPLLMIVSVVATAQKDQSARFAELITTEGLKSKLTILASADMEGRETATPGQKKAAAYIEAEFKRMGLQPGNSNSYQQLYPVYRDSLSKAILRVNGQPYTWDKDFVLPLRSLAFGNFTYNNVIFAGYGIVDAEGKINDLTGLDVKGKLVLVLDGSPEGYKPPAGAGRRFVSPASTNGKIFAARNAGAAAVLVVTADFPKKAITPTKGEMYLKPNTNSAVSGTVSAAVASAMLGRTKAMDMASIKSLEKGNYVAEVNIQTEKTVETLESSNVVGIIPGTDKKEEYLFLTGHYDHLGKRGDVIYYGADDDGSGTVGVMQMAEAFAAAAKKGNKPRRTLVFMTVSGEEKGLWGSDYYAEHPIFPLEKTTADLNTDMIGRVDTERKTGDTLNYIYVIGHDKLSSELPIINEGVNNKYTNLVLDYKYDDPKDQNQIYYRSDHYNFAKKGVPILFFYDGMLQADYHRPTDTVDKINFELMQKRTKLVFYTAWEIANRDNMLKRDTPLNMPNSR
jgi:Zn-dependent M28 family amino/carboxypeptidase